MAVLGVFLFHSLDPMLNRHDVPWEGSWRSFPSHVSEILFALASLGKFGVAIFFAISGFCIQLSYSKSKDKGWLPFFIRRGFRILPPYWFWLAVFALLTLTLAWKSGATPISLKNIGMHGLLLQNFRESIVFSINPSFWSLAVEAQLYLLFPALTFMVTKWGWSRSLAVVFLIEIGCRFWSSCHEMDLKPGNFFTLSYWGSWSVGAYVADRYASGQNLGLNKVPLVACLGLIFLTWAWEPASPYQFTVVALTTAVWLSHRLSPLAPSDGHPQTRRATFFSKPLTVLGLSSYSFYLIHQPVLMWSAKTFDDYQIHSSSIRFAWVTLYGLLVFGISLWSYRWIEMSTHRSGINLASRY